MVPTRQARRVCVHARWLAQARDPLPPSLTGPAPLLPAGAPAATQPLTLASSLTQQMWVSTVRQFTTSGECLAGTVAGWHSTRSRAGTAFCIRETGRQAARQLRMSSPAPAAGWPLHPGSAAPQQPAVRARSRRGAAGPSPLPAAPRTLSAAPCLGAISPPSWRHRPRHHSHTQKRSTRGEPAPAAIARARRRGAQQSAGGAAQHAGPGRRQRPARGGVSPARPWRRQAAHGQAGQVTARGALGGGLTARTAATSAMHASRATSAPSRGSSPSLHCPAQRAQHGAGGAGGTRQMPTLCTSGRRLAQQQAGPRPLAGARLQECGASAPAAPALTTVVLAAQAREQSPQRLRGRHAHAGHALDCRARRAQRRQRCAQAVAGSARQGRAQQAGAAPASCGPPGSPPA